MKELEAGVRTVDMDGLTWGASKLVSVGFGFKKLQINVVVEDEKVSVDDLQARIESDEDHVQSTDVVSLLVATTSAPQMGFHCPVRLLEIAADNCLQAAMQKL